MDTATEPKPAKRARKMAREPRLETVASDAAIAATEIAPAAPLPALQSKADMVLDLLRRPTGAAIDDLITVTGWLPHTTRAALTGLKKKGNVLISEKVEGTRRYRIEVAAA